MTHAFLFHLQIDKNPVWADKKGRVWVRCVFDDGQEDDVTIVEAQELMRAAKTSTTPRAKRKRNCCPPAAHDDQEGEEDPSPGAAHYDW